MPLLKLNKTEGQAQLSTIQLGMGHKKKVMTNLATITSVIKGNSDKWILPCIEVLIENKVLMFEELHRGIDQVQVLRPTHTRRHDSIDHTIIICRGRRMIRWGSVMTRHFVIPLKHKIKA